MFKREIGISDSLQTRITVRIKKKEVVRLSYRNRSTIALSLEIRIKMLVQKRKKE